ncbi:MAG: DUF418 domain-containing transporter [Desulfobacterales bacterium]
MSGKKSKQRIIAIDALRGLAVLLMLLQHIIYWVCGELQTSPAMPLLGALGGLAAPIFIVLAGAGVTLASDRHKKVDRLLAGRGLMIIGFGYVLNLLAPNWFSPESWYVLHMIGFGLLVAPVLRKAASSLLVVMILATVALTAIVQSSFNIPLHIGNSYMASADLPWGVLRLALAESFFPVFPWIGFFMAGLVAGRWLAEGALSLLLRAAGLLFAAAVMLSAVYAAGFEFVRHEPWIRIFKPIPNFYPALAPVTFFLMACALMLVFIFVSFYRSRISAGLMPSGRGSKLLADLGRCSLTIIMVHIPLIREPVVRLNIWRTFSTAETLASVLAVLILFSLSAMLWSRIHFKYGAEWLIRRAFP